MLDDDLEKKLHLIQARAIQSTNSAVSFSSVINQIVRKQIK